MSTTEKQHAVTNLTAAWPPESRNAMLEYLSAGAKRKILAGTYRDAANLAQVIDPRYVVTPALQLIATHIETVLRRPRHNLLINMHPQSGKTQLCAVYAPLRALMLNANCRIILTCYAASLAEESSRRCRELIEQHGTGVIDPVTGVAAADKLGYRLASGSNRVNAWKIAGARGGMVAVGWGASLTGKPADLLIIDDVVKNQMEADSANHRRKISEWFSTVALTRLSPDASIIHISTRWHPEDLAGQIISGEALQDDRFKTWKHINIPAIAERGIPDALGRQPGEAMESARGFTKESFEAIRREVGERTWYSMFQGVPRNPAGGLFLRAWFEPRAVIAPADPVAVIVGVDPADTGRDDETGIIAAALDQDGRIILTEDWSGKFTSDQWGRRAVTLALTVGAREISFEAYSIATTYKQVLEHAYRAIHADAAAKHRSGADLTDIERKALGELPPFTIHKWRGPARVDAVGRSAVLRQAFETRRARTVEHKLAVFEDQAADWFAGQHCPDRVAAAVIAHDRLDKLSGGARMTIATPINTRPDPVSRFKTPAAVQTHLARRLGRR